jgi:methylated-DNA-protein-cysteine methyltransferase-like protein
MFEQIYEVVRRIPRGRVATYGQVAALAGNPRASRVVGWALHDNPDPEHIPCHRVVNRFGGLSDAFAFGGKDEHQSRLEQEGVKVAEYRVDLERYQWDGVEAAG